MILGCREKEVALAVVADLGDTALVTVQTNGLHLDEKPIKRLITQLYSNSYYKLEAKVT